MLKLFPRRTRSCERSRRDFLVDIGSLSALGLTLPNLLRATASATGRSASAAAESTDTASSDKGVNAILLWTRGGTSHHDSLDPKPDAGEEVRGEFAPIDTVVPGVQFTEMMPHFAAELGRFSVMRNLNPINGSHSVADYIMMSGHKFNPSFTHPCYGAVVSKELGYRSSLPPFIQLGTHVDHRFNGGLAGFLGLEHNAFVVPGDPNKKGFTVRDVTLPNGITAARVDRRREALKLVDTMQRQLGQQLDALAAIDTYYENAFNIITSPETKNAFDLSREDDKTRDAYGRTELGQSCLLARRMIEAGTRFVTVTSGGWDTHSNNFKGLRRLLPPFDQAFPALVADLGQRGLLDNTFVFWLTDFGRTPKINTNAGRDHWSTASIAAFAGAGVPGGQIIGETDDTGSQPVGDAVLPQDIAATVYSKLGIPLDTHHMTPDGRPVGLCAGSPVPELMG